MNFVRGASWIYYRVPPSQHLGGEEKGNNPDYTEEEMREFREHPETMKAVRKAMIARTNKAFRMVSLSPLQHATSPGSLSLPSYLCSAFFLTSALPETVYQGLRREQRGHGDGRSPNEKTTSKRPSTLRDPHPQVVIGMSTNYPGRRLPGIVLAAQLRSDKQSHHTHLGERGAHSRWKSARGRCL